jgi:hypothetical protein
VNVYGWHFSSLYYLWSRGAKDLIKEYWSRQGKKKGDRIGRKSDPKPKSASRRPAAVSVESSPEPAQATKKRGRTRTRPVSDEGDEEEDTKPRKKGRKSNGTSRKATPSPAPSSDRDSPAVELLEPDTIKKWRSLPSWEEHIDTIDTVERIRGDELLIYFKLYVFCLIPYTWSDSLRMLFVGRVRRQRAKHLRMCVRRNSQKRCALPQPFNFLDLNRFHILAPVILRD